MHLNGKKIAFVVYQYPLAVSTMIINSIYLLKQHNDVEVIIDEQQVRGSDFDQWLKELFILIKKNTVVDIITRVVGRLCRVLHIKNGRLKWWMQNCYLIYTAHLLRREFAKKKYDILIPIESLGLIVTDWAKTNKSDIIYYDMELLDWSHENPLYENKLMLKTLQHKALESVDHVMITSPNRAKLFLKINDFSEERVSILPVVPCKREIVDRSKYFHNKFHISKDKQVVLYAGNFMPWAQCLEIIQSMLSWPKDVVLVMHTWNKVSLDSDYFQLMQKAANDYPVYFSSDFLLYNDLALAFTSADIGLLFYQDIDSNFNEIIFSSNKMGEYISAGLPVICSPFPSLNEFVSQNGIGLSSSFDDLGKSIETIIQRNSFYRQNVVKCNEEHFVFENYFSIAFERYVKQSQQRDTV